MIRILMTVATVLLLAGLSRDAAAQHTSDVLPGRMEVWKYRFDDETLLTSDSDTLVITEIGGPAFIPRLVLVADSAVTGIDSLQVRLREAQTRLVGFNPADYPSDGMILQEFEGWMLESNDAIVVQAYGLATPTGQIRIFIKYDTLY